MRLLSPKEIKATRASAEEGLTKRINDTEKALNKRTKDLALIDETLRASKASADSYIESVQSHITELERKRESLERSIDAQEYKRKLKSLEEKENTLALFEQGIADQVLRIAKKKEEIETWERLLQDRYESLNEQEGRLRANEQAVRDESSRVDASRASVQREIEASRRMRESSENLENSLKVSLQEVEKKSKALDLEREALILFVETEKKRVAQDRIAIKDGYENLAKAREEILKRKT